MAEIIAGVDIAGVKNGGVSRRGIYRRRRFHRVRLRVTGELAYTPTRGLDILRTGQLAD